MTVLLVNSGLSSSSTPPPIFMAFHDLDGFSWVNLLVDAAEDCLARPVAGMGHIQVSGALEARVLDQVNSVSRRQQSILCLKIVGHPKHGVRYCCRFLSRHRMYKIELVGVQKTKVSLIDINPAHKNCNIIFKSIFIYHHLSPGMQTQIFSQLAFHQLEVMQGPHNLERLHKLSHCITKNKAS